jgi:hypothetical protein
MLACLLDRGEIPDVCVHAATTCKCCLAERLNLWHTLSNVVPVFFVFIVAHSLRRKHFAAPPQELARAAVSSVEAKAGEVRRAFCAITNMCVGLVTHKRLLLPHR